MTIAFLLHQMLERSAALAPDALAVVAPDATLTYRRLDELANRVANLFVANGLEVGDRVAIHLDKSSAAVVAIFGVLKAGGAYVPLDPGAPARRTATVVANCEAKFLVAGVRQAESGKSLVDELGHLARMLVLDEGGQDGDATVLTLGDVLSQPEGPPGVELIDQDLALILYTSGSTGEPKGVMLTHRNVLTFVEWAVHEFGVTASDRLSQLAPLHFDLSTFDLYGAAMAGASVHLVPRATAMFPIQVRRFLEDHEISVMYTVPSILTLMVEHAKLEIGDLPNLRTLLFAGEVFPTKYLSRLMRLLPGVTFANLYGPTETNVCTAYTVPDAPAEDGPTISIGRSIANVSTYVMSEDGSRASVGEVGELLVRGGTVMRGYWADEDRTAERLVPNPFGSDLVYRTGDLVREEPDGNLTFLGRRDAQIKSRGYRIELGDIEAAINAHPAVVESVVVAIPDELVTNKIAAVVVTNDDLDVRDLTGFCAERIPKYMLPGAISLRRSALPKTSTGKIDRQTVQREVADQ